jgi:hypothetical protein
MNDFPIFIPANSNIEREKKIKSTTTTTTQNVNIIGKTLQRPYLTISKVELRGKRNIIRK